MSCAPRRNSSHFCGRIESTGQVGFGAAGLNQPGRQSLVQLLATRWWCTVAPRGCTLHAGLPQSTDARCTDVLQRQRGALPCIGASSPLPMHMEAPQPHLPQSHTAAPAAGCPQPRSPSNGRPPSPRSQTRSAGEEGERGSCLTTNFGEQISRRLQNRAPWRWLMAQPRRHAACCPASGYTRWRLAATGSRHTEHQGIMPDISNR